jgi:hypothetical protein
MIVFARRYGMRGCRRIACNQFGRCRVFCDGRKRDWYDWAMLAIALAALAAVLWKH